jgi:hypothetical protein
MKSDVKLYEPTWRMRLKYIFERVLDIIFFTRLARRPVGPWCSRCGVVRPDLSDEIHECYRCGLVDEAAKKRWEEHLSLEKGRRRAHQSDPFRRDGKQRRNRGEPSFAKLFREMPSDLFAGMGPMGFVVASALLLTLSKKKHSWWKAFDLERAPDTKELAKVAYKDALMRAHPDQGGSEKQFKKVRGAWSKAERYYARCEASQAKSPV